MKIEFESVTVDARGEVIARTHHSAEQFTEDLGKGISLGQFKEFMSEAHNLLTLEIASVPEEQKRSRQQQHLENMVAGARGWSQAAGAGEKRIEAQHAISA